MRLKSLAINISDKFSTELIEHLSHLNRIYQLNKTLAKFKPIINHLRTTSDISDTKIAEQVMTDHNPDMNERKETNDGMSGQQSSWNWKRGANCASNHYQHYDHYYHQNTLRPKELKAMVYRCRRFNMSSPTAEPNAFKFSIMSYNILSQNLLENHRYLYEHCQESDLQWPERGHRIRDELLRSDSDIICLQEVHSNHFNQLFLPALKQKGYNFVYKQRTGDKSDGCAIVYKEDKFSLINTIKLDLMREDLSALLNRDNVAIIAELEPKHDSKPKNRNCKLFVANTHLLYNPKRGDVKLAQIRLLIAELDKVALCSKADGTSDHHPIILCGDFNSEPNSLLFDFITKGSASFDGHRVGDISGQKEGLDKGKHIEDHHLRILGITSDTRFEMSGQEDSDSREKAIIKHKLKLSSIVTEFTDRFGNKLVSTHSSYDSGLVDYIFYDKSKLKLIGYDRLMTIKHMQQQRIPNSYLGSDHLALKAMFAIT